MNGLEGVTRKAGPRWLLAGLAAIALVSTALTPATADPIAEPIADPVADSVEHAPRADPSSLPSGRTDFRALEDYEHDMAALARRYPQTVRTFELPHQTTEGRTVHGLEISENVAAERGKPVFADVGMHHGDEWPSGELTMEFAYYLATNQDDPYVRDALRRTRVVIVPVVNPDGLVEDTRENGAGVDMNRNYGFGWLPGESDADHGTAPWSEPESRNVRWLLSTRQATVFNSQHTCLQMVLYPPLQKEAGPIQDVGRVHALAASMAGHLGPTYEALASADDYETTGEATDWAYYATRGSAVTTETCPNAGAPDDHDFDSEVLDAFERNRDALMEALATAGDPREHSAIVGRAPVGSTLTLRKSFRMYTGSYEHDDGDGANRPDGFDQELRSTMTVDEPDGSFELAVNPSYRPVPPYQEDGMHGHQEGFLTEPWLLTCESPTGQVASERVNVNVGETVSRVLSRCGELPAVDAAPAYVRTSVRASGSGTSGSDTSGSDTSGSDTSVWVEVTAAGRPVDGGVVELSSGGEPVATLRLRDGTASATVEGLEPGARLVAAYEGSAGVGSARASRVVPAS